MLEKVFADERLGLIDREITINYAGRDKGGPHNDPLKVEAVDRPPSASVMLVVQPSANDTCSRYRVVAAGIPASDLAAKINAFRGHLTRANGKYHILPDDPGPRIDNQTITISPRAVAAQQTKQVSSEARVKIVQELEVAGQRGRSSRELKALIAENFPDLKTAVGIIIQPLINKGLVAKFDRYGYCLKDIPETDQATAREIATSITKVGRVKQCILDFLPSRPNQEAATEHLRQRVNTYVGKTNEAMFWSALRELKDARKIVAVDGTRGRYQLVPPPVEKVEEPLMVQDQDVGKLAIQELTLEPPPGEGLGEMPPIIPAVDPIENSIEEIRAVASKDDLPVADVIGKVGELLVALSHMLRST